MQACSIVFRLAWLLLSYMCVGSALYTLARFAGYFRDNLCGCILLVRRFVVACGVLLYESLGRKPG